MSRILNKLPRQVIILSWVSFFADVSSEMIYPLMPLFLVGVLGSPALALGIIEGSAQLIVSVISVFSGSISDDARKRISFVRWGYGLPILGKSLICIAGSWHLVLFGRAIDRLGKGLRSSPRDALIAEAVKLDQRGQAFGFHRGLDTAGAFIGVMLAALILWLLQLRDTEVIYRVVFLIAAVIAVFALSATFFVSESKPPEFNLLETNTLKSSTILAAMRGLGREYWITLAILMVFSFANSSDAFLLLRAADLGISSLNVIFIYAVYNLSYALFSYPAGILSDRHGRWRVITSGWAIYMIVYVGVARSDGSLIWGLFALYGVYMAMTEGVSKALVVDCVPHDKKGTAVGVLYMSLGLSALASNLLAGYLWDYCGTAVPFWVGAFCALAAILLVLLSGRLKNQPIPNPTETRP